VPKADSQPNRYAAFMIVRTIFNDCIRLDRKSKFDLDTRD
jgi:hypothetical protein